MDLRLLNKVVSVTSQTCVNFLYLWPVQCAYGHFPHDKVNWGQTRAVLKYPCPDNFDL